MKKILAAIIVALLLGGTAFAFSYWDNTSQSSSVSLTAGEATTLSLTVSGDGSGAGTLVPSTVLVGTDDVTSITMEYTVSLNKTFASDLTFAVSESNVLIGGSSTYDSLVNIAITANSTINGDAPETVTVVITLTEPADETAYNAVANATITFDLTFVAPAPIV